MVSPGSHSAVSKALHQHLCQTGKTKNTENVQDFLRTFAEVRAQLCRANTPPSTFLTRPVLQERNTRMIEKDEAGVGATPTGATPTCGARVEVKFSDGKLYGGHIDGVEQKKKKKKTKAQWRVDIRYDDGTTELCNYPNRDVRMLPLRTSARGRRLTDKVREGADTPVHLPAGKVVFMNPLIHHGTQVRDCTA
jgi:hypothetical protein